MVVLVAVEVADSATALDNLLDVLLHELGNLKHHVGFKHHCARATVNEDFVLVGLWSPKAQDRLVFEERQALRLVAWENAHALEADGEPELLGPFFLSRLRHLKQVAPIAFPSLAHLHKTKGNKATKKPKKR